jgi:hypothetical protein
LSRISGSALYIAGGGSDRLIDAIIPRGGAEWTALASALWS